MADELFDLIAPEGAAAGPDDGSPAARGTVRLRVHVRPGAGRSAVVGRHGDALAVRVAAPPVDGRANAECAELLRDELGVRQVELVGGEKGADKRFEIADVDLEEFRRRLHEVLEEAGVHRGAGRAGGRARRR